jgi:large subunit ribosomal protein L13
MITKVQLTKNEDRKWYLIDAEGAILGRLSTVAADLLRGKGKPTYSPNLDSGDNVIIVNAAAITLSKESNKENKAYYRHSGYPGGIKKETFREAMEKHPERVVSNSIKGMMPKNKLAKSQLTRLKVYVGNEHPHTQEIIKLAPTFLSGSRPNNDNQNQSVEEVK